MPTHDTHNYPPPIFAEEELEGHTPRLPIENHYGYGVIGIGLCSICSEVRTLYVHSLINTHDESNGLCHGCMSSRLGQFALERQRQLETMNVSGEIIYYEFLYRLYCAVYSEWSDVPQHTRNEILEHEQGCPACAKFFLPGTQDTRTDYQPIEAHALNEQEPKPRLVHRRCASTCGNCRQARYIPFGSNTWFLNRATVSVQISISRATEVCLDCLRGDDFVDYARCSGCSNYAHPDHLWTRFGDGQYCGACEQHIYECDDCGTDYWEDDGHECDYEEPTSRSIHQWDFKPRGGFTFHGSDPHNLYLGFELETEVAEADSDMFNEYADNTADLLTRESRGFLKYDGSLEHGFEIVTQPHTLEAYMSEFPFEVIDDLRRNGFRSWNTDTCGFHVHVSRTAFGWDHTQRKQSGKTEAHMLRFTKLIYDNRHHVRRLAGRSSSQWASFDDAGRLTQKIKQGHQSNGRYSAVNVSNTHTLEVRVFRGSMRIERIKSYLEFVHSAVEYTRELSVSPNNNTLVWGRYRKWLHQDQAEKYPHLVSLLSNLPRSIRAESESE